MKSKPKNRFVLPGHSLLEIIVSTIIILVTFLLFSSLLGQLFSSRRTVPATAVLLKLSSFKTSSGTLDTSEIKNAYSASSTIIRSRNIDSFNFWEVAISDKNSGEKILLYYTTSTNSDVVASLFQQ
jgi:hypothetical protein